MSAASRILSVGAIAISCALFLFDSAWASLAGYCFAALVANGLVIAYRYVDQRRRGVYYSPLPGYGSLATAILVIGTALAAVHVWQFATEVAR